MVRVRYVVIAGMAAAAAHMSLSGVRYSNPKPDVDSSPQEVKEKTSPKTPPTDLFYEGNTYNAIDLANKVEIPEFTELHIDVNDASYRGHDYRGPDHIEVIAIASRVGQSGLEARIKELVKQGKPVAEVFTEGRPDVTVWYDPQFAEYLKQNKDLKSQVYKIITPGKNTEKMMTLAQSDTVTNPEYNPRSLLPLSHFERLRDTHPSILMNYIDPSIYQTFSGEYQPKVGEVAEKINDQ